MLKHFFLKKLKFTSPASRNCFYFKPRNLIFWKPHKLTLRKRNFSGRNDSGRIVARSKSSLLVRIRSFQINYSFRYIKTSFVSYFFFIPFKNKIVSLIHFSSGVLSYFLATQKHKLFSLFYLNRDPQFRFFFPKKTFNMLLKIRNLANISLIEIFPGRGSQYCRSSGTIAKLLKFDIKNYSSLIRLPSGERKLFSCYGYAAYGRVGIKENRNFFNSKAGYWRKFGCKPTVRGVAMNPVDHPHGGRTKSIRYPKTPWGKTTKFK